MSVHDPSTPTGRAAPAPPLDEPTGDLRTAAVRRLRAKREFAEHLIAYVGVNGLLWTIWLVVGLTADAWFPWPLFPMAGWGIGLALHAWATFGPPSRPISEKAIDREIQRLRSR